MGAENFYLYDMDTVEIHNVGVSQFIMADIGMYKVDALANHIHDVSAMIVGEEAMDTIASVYKINGRFENKGYQYTGMNDIVVLGFDSMQARLDAVKIICRDSKLSPELIIDGRMGAEHFQQYAIKKPTISKYEKIWYSDADGDPEPCTAKATSYCSNIAGSFIVNCIRKIITDQPYNARFSIHLPTLSLDKSKLIS